MKKFFIFFAIAFLLLGCSHIFMEPDVRLQIENQTEDTFLLLSVVSEDGDSTETWIDDTLAPGERSHVETGAWVGTFNLLLKIQSVDTDSVSSILFPSIDFDGGSVFAQISKSDGTWIFNIR